MDQDYSAGRHRLPGYNDDRGDDDRGYGGPGSAAARFNRDQGVRRVRRMSNWTAAALVAGVAVTTGYFAHAATVASQQATSPGTVSTGQPGTSGQPGTTAPGHKATVTGPVATSGGSGVTGQAGTTAPGHKATVTHPVVTSGGSGVTGGAGGGSQGRDN